MVPQTREAFLVHTMDNLGGKLGIIDRLEQERQPGSAWSGFDRAFGGSVYFAPEDDAAPAAPAPGAGGAPTLAGAAAASAAAAAVAPARPAEPAPLAQVPRGAFEDSAAWQPPHPDQLEAPPLPSGPLTATPDHADGSSPRASEPDAPAAPARDVVEHPEAFSGEGVHPTDAAGPREPDEVSPAAARLPTSPQHTGAETIAAQRATAGPDRSGPAEPEPLPF